MRVTKRVHFDAAHHLPNYDGPCSRLHGHRWELEASIDGNVNPKTGMVVDFKRINEALERAILHELDHYQLNGKVKNPTAENLIVYIGRELILYGMLWSHLKLWEAPDSCVELSREEFERTQN